MAKIQTFIIDSYEELAKNIPLILEAYGIKKTWLQEKTGIPYKRFYRRMKAGNWTPQELRKIANVINKD